MIWFTCDLHLNHNAIINLRDRHFKSVEEMNESLIRNLNERVKENDTVYILGDISHRTPVEKVNYFIGRLNGKSRHGSIHLHGHIHSKGDYNLQQKADGILRYDVGVDANNFYPVSIDEIKNLLLED